MAGQRRTKVAFVLGGGGNLGAVQVGMLQALVERGIQPDFILGCSVGALNGVALAADPTIAGVERLRELWLSLDGEGVLPSASIQRAVQLARKTAGVQDAESLRRVIDRILRVDTFADLEVPFQCVATNLDEAAEHWFTEGPLRDALVASSAIPAIYPPVDIDGVRYIDGAVVSDVPVLRAAELGARQIWVLYVGSLDRPRREPRRPLDVAVHAYWIARRHRFQRDLAALPGDVEAIVLPTGEPPVMRFNDFTRSRELMENAYTATQARLDEHG